MRVSEKRILRKRTKRREIFPPTCPKRDEWSNLDESHGADVSSLSFSPLMKRARDAPARTRVSCCPRCSTRRRRAWTLSVDAPWPWPPRRHGKSGAVTRSLPTGIFTSCWGGMDPIRICKGNGTSSWQEQTCTTRFIKCSLELPSARTLRCLLDTQRQYIRNLPIVQRAFFMPLLSHRNRLCWSGLLPRDQHSLI